MGSARRAWNRLRTNVVALRQGRRVWIVAIAALAFGAGPATAATYAPVGPGSHGPAVCGLDWMLQGHRPSAYRGIVTYNPKRHVVPCFYGEKTAAAVKLMKRRLGFPDRAVNGTAGTDFLRILRGQQKRPLGYLLRAQERFPVPVPTPVKTTCVERLISLAKAEVGVEEQPLGSNRGPRIDVYERVTGTVGLSWCVAFQQWLLAQEGYGTIANDTAGVYAMTDWAHARGWLHALPRAGDIVLFQDWRRPNGGHAGLVTKVFAHSFESAEGNSANGVRLRYHSLVDRQPIFLQLPNCSS